MRAARVPTGRALLAFGCVAMALPGPGPAWAQAARAEVRAQPRPQPGCLGERQPLTVASGMPYALVTVGGHAGYFLLDFGASLSSITPAGFQGGSAPQLDAPDGRYADFVFFGRWAPVQLKADPQPAVQSLTTADGQARIRQAGVIGTDFLSQHIYTLDYRGGHLWRAARGGFCTDAALKQAGYRAVSTQGYYGPDRAALVCPAAGAPPGGCAPIPTLPIRIGRVQAVAQLDTGFDDGLQPHSVNINPALFEALRASGLRLEPRPDLALQLSTCVPGVVEPVQAYRLPPGAVFGLVDAAGDLLPRAPAAAVTLYVKRPPPAAAVCGGIGTWAQPAAQIGASFVAGGSLVVDPFGARVWLR